MDTTHAPDGRTPLAARPPVDDAGFRAALGSFATGVGVMTVAAQGTVHGMTANAVTSVSLAPPLILVCVERAATMAAHVAEAGAFAITFLAEDQGDLSTWFADPTRPSGRAMFEGVASTTQLTGAPLLEGGTASIECRVRSIMDGGDHLVVLGEVVGIDVDPQAQPLVYFRGGYGRLRPPSGG